MRMVSRIVVLGSLACGGVPASLAQSPPKPATLGDLIVGSDGGAATDSADDPRQARLPVPEGDAVGKARKLIQHVYEDDYKAAAKNPEALIQKLLVDAGKSENPAQEYAYLLEAEEVATIAGHHDRALALVDRRAEQYDIDGIQARVERLTTLLAPKLREDARALTKLYEDSRKLDARSLAKLYEHACATATQGMTQDDLAPAKAAANLAAGIAKSIVAMGKTTRNDSVVADGLDKQARAKDLAAEITERTRGLAEYREAVELLKKDPDDPAANGIIGRYLCFVCDDWEAGLPALIKGDRKDLAEIAALETAARAADASDVQQFFLIAGRWWDAAEGAAAKGSAPGIRSHAAAIYSSIEGVLGDRKDPREAQLAKKRIAEASKSGAATRSRKPVLPKRPWDAMLCITCDNRYTVWLNGQMIGSGDDWARLGKYPVQIRDGDILAIEAADAEAGQGSAGLFCCLVLQDGRAWGTGNDWRCTTTAPPADWQTQLKPLPGEANASQENVHGAHAKRGRSYGGRVSGHFIWSANAARRIWVREVIDLRRFR